MKRLLLWILWISVGTCITGMAFAVILYMLGMIQDAMANNNWEPVAFEILPLALLAVVFVILALAVWGRIDVTNPRLAWLFIGVFAAMIACALCSEIRNALAEQRLAQTLLTWALLVIVAIVLLAVWGLMAWGIDSLRRQIRRRQYRLPEGVTMEMVLSESPYQVVRSQEGTFILDRRTGEFVDWKDPDGADVWIIRQYLKERQDER